MRLSITTGTLFFVILLMSPPLSGREDVMLDSAQHHFRQANVLYQQGLFTESLEQYLSAYASGAISADLLYNIGNCHFKLDEIPAAILFYERARRLDPSNEDILYNLALARTRIIDKIEPVPQLFFIRWWHQLRDLYGTDGWAGVTLISFVVLLALVFLFLTLRTVMMRRLILWPAVLALIIMAHSLAFSIQKHRKEILRDEGIIMQATVTVKSSPDRASIDLFVIHEGTMVSIRDAVNEWVEIRIPSGNVGWVEESVLERI